MIMTKFRFGRLFKILAPLRKKCLLIFLIFLAVTWSMKQINYDYFDIGETKDVIASMNIINVY